MMVLRISALAGLVGALACHADQITAGQHLDIVAAFRDPGTEFNTIGTYALPDTVVHLTTDPTADIPAEVTREFDDQILARVRSRLDDRGYRQEPEPDRNPIDVVVLVSAIATPDFRSWMDYPWFDWWAFFPGFAFGAFDATWGIDYSWADESVAFEYDVGTIVVEMIDAHSIDQVNQRVHAVWSGAANGILSPEAAEEVRVLSAIDEIFALSPYLGREP